MKRFENKVMLVTGGTSGIGLATAKQLQAEGAKVIITGMNPERIKSTQAALPEALVIRNDASDINDNKALADFVEQKGLKLDGLFLNAGLGQFIKLEDLKPEDFDDQFHLNVRGPIFQLKYMSHLINDNASIVITGSSTVGNPSPMLLCYSATKAAVRQMVRSLASSFAPRKIRVNIVTPSVTDTGFHTGGGMSEDEMRTFRENYVKNAILHELGQAEDVAAIACFLLSNESRHTTGSEFRCDGGYNMI